MLGLHNAFHTGGVTTLDVTHTATIGTRSTPGVDHTFSVTATVSSQEMNIFNRTASIIPTTVGGTHVYMHNHHCVLWPVYTHKLSFVQEDPLWRVQLQSLLLEEILHL